MFIYVSLFVLLIVLWVISKSENNKRGSIATKNNSRNIIATAAVFLVIGLRDITVGADTQLYKILYESGYDWGEKEIGYTYLTRFCNNSGISFNQFLIIIAFFCAVCFYVFVSKYSDDYVYSLIVFVGLGNFSMFMTGLRQTIAISIVTLALFAMMKSKWYLFIPLVLLASTFHYSALIVLPVYLLKFIKFNRKSILVIAVLSWGTLIVFRDVVFNTFSKYLPEKYADSLIESAGKYKNNILVIAIEVCIFAFCWFCFNGEKGSKNHSKNVWDTLMLLHIIAVCFLLQSQSSLQIGRIMYYFDVAKIVLIPNATTRMNDKDEIVVKLIILALIIGKFFISVPGGYSKIDNYTFFFTN